MNEGTPPMIARICRVSGRVQGVYYRATAAGRARELGITGHARNLPDGSVEILAHGEEQAVEVFVAWLWTGSAASKVTAVVVSDAPPGLQPPAQFTTG